MSVIEQVKGGARNFVRLYAQTPLRGRSRLRSFSDRWFRPRGDIEIVQVGPCSIALSHQYEATRNMAYGIYERHEIALIRRVLKPGDTAVDVGANVGYLSAQMAQQVGPEGKVYSFEPGPTPFQSLRAVQESNRFGNMEIFQMAVGAEDRQATYYETENVLSKGYGRIDDHPSEKFQHVQAYETTVISLVSFFSARPVERVRLIKIDVEGHEKQVIEGLTPLLDRGIRPVILTEVTMFGQSDGSLEGYRETLLRYGYRMYAIRKSLIEVSPLELSGGFHGNVAWVSD